MLGRVVQGRDWSSARPLVHDGLGNGSILHLAHMHRCPGDIALSEAADDRFLQRHALPAVGVVDKNHEQFDRCVYLGFFWLIVARALTDLQRSACDVQGKRTEELAPSGASPHRLRLAHQLRDR